MLLLIKIFLYSGEQEVIPMPPENFGYKLSYYKEWKQNDDRTDYFPQETSLQASEIQKFLHFRVIRNANDKIISIAFYNKNLQIAPYVSDDGIWFHMIKFEYEGNRLVKKTFYRESGKPEARYIFEYNDLNKIMKVEKQDYDVNPYRQSEYFRKYFILFTYHNNGKFSLIARFDDKSKPQEKLYYDQNGRIEKYERFYNRTDILFYYIIYSYDNQGNASTKRVYNIDGVLVEIPNPQDQRRYEALLQTRYPSPGRRGLNQEQRNNSEQNQN